MKTNELYFVSFVSLFLIVFIFTVFSSGITGMAVASSDASIIGNAYRFTLDQFTTGGTLNKILLTVLIILIILLVIEIILLFVKRHKRDVIKKIKYMIDSANQELDNKNFVKARDIYMHIRERFSQLSGPQKEKIKHSCLNLHEKISKEIK